MSRPNDCNVFSDAEPIFSVHRLVASLAFLLRLSPGYDTQISPLLEVLQTSDTLKAKLGSLKKPEVKKLVEEVATKLCP